MPPWQQGNAGWAADGAGCHRTQNDPPRTRTWNLRLRRPTPYPLGQRTMRKLWNLRKLNASRKMWTGEQNLAADRTAQQVRPSGTRNFACESMASSPRWRHARGVEGGSARPRMPQGKMLPRGLEPQTFRLLAERSNQLSYESMSLWPI